MIAVNLPVLFVFFFWHFLLVLRVTFLLLFCPENFQGQFFKSYSTDYAAVFQGP